MPFSFFPLSLHDALPILFIGALTIESQPPGATVFVDQQPLGKTPIHLKSLRAGEHLVWLEHEGFERWTASVLVPADRQTRVRRSEEHTSELQSHSDLVCRSASSLFPYTTLFRSCSSER